MRHFAMNSHYFVIFHRLFLNFGYIITLQRMGTHGLEQSGLRFDSLRTLQNQTFSCTLCNNSLTFFHDNITKTFIQKSVSRKRKWPSTEKQNVLSNSRIRRPHTRLNRRNYGARSLYLSKRSQWQLCKQTRMLADVILWCWLVKFRICRQSRPWRGKKTT